MNDNKYQFRLAPMSPIIRCLTIAVLVVPLILLAAAILVQRLLAGPAFFVIVIFVWVWLRFRPTHFIVHPNILEVVWPLKRRKIFRAEISAVRIINREELRHEIGWGLRIGVGGLWGGFGWLWTRKRGIVQMYISRIDRFIWIELRDNRPWLITPEDPEAFAQALLQ